MANVCNVGGGIRLGNTIKVSDVVTDPTTLTITVEDPSGNLDSYTYAAAQVAKTSTGVYYYDLALDEAGTWSYRWVSTGAALGADEGQFEVRRRLVNAS